MRLHVLYYNKDGIRCERNEPRKRELTSDDVQKLIDGRNKAR